MSACSLMATAVVAIIVYLLVENLCIMSCAYVSCFEAVFLWSLQKGPKLSHSFTMDDFPEYDVAKVFKCRRETIIVVSLFKTNAMLITVKGKQN